MTVTDKANAASGFYGSLTPGRRPALLVVDFQLGFTDPGLSPLASDCTHPIIQTNRLVPAVRQTGGIVVFTAVAYSDNYADAGIWLQKCPSLRDLKRGTKTADIDSRLDRDPERDVLLLKTQASAFFGTPLVGILGARRCDMVIIAGCTTSGCVRATAVDAIQNGFAPFVVRDCVTDRSPSQHESNLIDLESKYAEVVGVEHMLAILGSIGPEHRDRSRI